MDELQELLQRTETIQKINALQEHAAVEIFSWPAYSGKDRLKRGIRKYLLTDRPCLLWTDIPGPTPCWPEGFLRCRR